jgi:hypothetical protein
MVESSKALIKEGRLARGLVRFVALGRFVASAALTTSATLLIRPGQFRSEPRISPLSGYRHISRCVKKSGN